MMRTLIVPLVVVCVLLAGCVGKQNGGGPTTGPTQVSQAVSAESSAEPNQEQVVSDASASLIGDSDEVEIGEMI